LAREYARAAESLSRFDGLLADQWTNHPTAHAWYLEFAPTIPAHEGSPTPPPVAESSAAGAVSSKRATSKPVKSRESAKPSKKGVATHHDPPRYCKSSGLFVLLRR
jgi:hypothetical protein